MRHPGRDSASRNPAQSAGDALPFLQILSEFPLPREAGDWTFLGVTRPPWEPRQKDSHLSSIWQCERHDLAVWIAY